MESQTPTQARIPACSSAMDVAGLLCCPTPMQGEGHELHQASRHPSSLLTPLNGHTTLALPGPLEKEACIFSEMEALRA